GFCPNRAVRKYRAGYSLHQWSNILRTEKPHCCRCRQRNCRIRISEQEGIPRQVVRWSKQPSLRSIGESSSKMEVGQPGRYSSAGGAIQKALLDEKRFIDIFDGIAFFANGGSKGVQ